MVISHIYVSLPEGIINNNGYTWGFLSHRGSSSHNRAIGFWYQVMVVGLWATTKWNVMVKNMFYYSDCHFNSSFEPIEGLFNHNFPIFCSSSQIINLYIYIYTHIIPPTFQWLLPQFYWQSIHPWPLVQLSGEELQSQHLANILWAFARVRRAGGERLGEFRYFPSGKSTMTGENL